MPELPPTTARKPTDPDEPDRTGRHDIPPTPAAFSTPDDIEPGTIIAGKYKLLEAIGEGGMGAVWMAQQIEPVKRHVALKLIKSGMDSKTVVARFEAERQALSMMDHPNIARVFDGGTTPNGRPFFVMELVKGTPITEFCDQRKLTPRQRLELFIPVCNAIQHAHQKGIIHRDIKPSNVLVALHDDKPVPKVIDFGVAKATSMALTESTLNTGFEQVVGTPLYMSPEQATFNQLDIDTRSDVYSLGVLLYELLTGTTPIERARFKKAALLEMLRIVREEEPPRPSNRLSSTDTKLSIAAVRGTEPARLTKELRNELDWVVMRSLEKDRARRYESAGGFAADVQRYLSGEPVLAHPPSTTYRMKKFVRRHRGPVIAASLVFLALIGGAVGTVYGAIKADGEREANGLREQAETERDAKEVARSLAVRLQGVADAGRIEEARLRGIADDARDGEKKAKAEVAFLNYAHAVDLALREYSTGNIARALELLESCPQELRGWEWSYVNRLCHADLLTLKGHTSRLSSASFSGDGRRVVTASDDTTARVWDAETGQELALLQGHTKKVNSASFSGDGRRVVTASDDTTARVWDAESGKEIALLKGHTVFVQSASFSGDGRRVVTASDDKTARVWDAESGKEIALLKGHTKEVRSASFSGDGRRVVTASGDNTARVWDAESGKEIALPKGHTKEVQSASFSGDGRRVVTACWDKTARVWDAESGKEIALIKGHTGVVISASFSGDGRRVVTASFDGTARVWDAESGQELALLKGHSNVIMSASLSGDGRRVVTASHDTTARVWDAAGKELALLKGHMSGVRSASLSGDGRRVVTASVIASNDTTARVLDAVRGQELALLKGHTKRVNSASFSWDGHRVVTRSADLTARVWDAETGQELALLKGHTKEVNSASFSWDGRRVVTASWDNTARVWDAESGKELAVLKGHTSRVKSASFSGDGLRVVTASEDNTARVWDAATGQELAPLKGHTKGVNSASFSWDGRRVVTASEDNTARVWDAESGKEIALLKGHTGFVQSASFSGDGRRVVTASIETARVWDAITGKLMLTLSGHTGYVFSAKFGEADALIRTAGDSGFEPDPLGQNSIRVLIYDTRPASETFRKYLEAPPPRPKP